MIKTNEQFAAANKASVDSLLTFSKSDRSHVVL